MDASCQRSQPIKAVASWLRYQVPKWLAFASASHGQVAGTGSASTAYSIAADLDLGHVSHM